MILRQYLHFDPVGASYLFGCAGRASAAVVDPVGDIAPYLSVAQETGMRIRYVIDTHLHADHVSSARTLAEAAGADYVLHESAQVRFPFRGARDEERDEHGRGARRTARRAHPMPRTLITTSPATTSNHTTAHTMALIAA